ncbi:MAG: type II toxin-antitoxin system Phd/YefM family antitoxin [Actinobacteria bacterium]|nr:type II toxin-antitoxin system Phd/YefM family antitoxin [Actinomycetota bacterium]
MVKTVKATMLRDHLADVLKEVSKGKGYFIVTKKGHPVSALVNLDFFEDLLAATSPEYLEGIKEARADYEAGRVFSHKEVFGEL